MKPAPKKAKPRRMYIKVRTIEEQMSAAGIAREKLREALPQAEAAVIKLAAALFFVLLALATVGAIDLAEEKRLSLQGYVKEHVTPEGKDHVSTR